VKSRGSFSLAAIGAVIALVVIAAPATGASTGTVRIGETNNRYHFTPATVFVNIGGQVTWTNGSDAPHTVTSDTAGELASPTVGAGGTFSHTFSAAGTFAYHCAIHPYMIGKVVVLAAGTTPPPTDAIATGHAAPGDPGFGLAVAAIGGLVGTGIVLRRVRRAL
jgi:plastocyanin